MPHTKKKASILTTATSLVGFAVMSFSSGDYVAGGILLTTSLALFGLYEFFQIKEIPVDADEITGGAETIADGINDRIDDE